MLIGPGLAYGPEVFVVFGGTRVGTQGFVLVMQVFYCLSPTSRYFALVSLEMGSLEVFALAILEP
jgi:hypothetical protein